MPQDNPTPEAKQEAILDEVENSFSPAPGDGVSTVEEWTQASKSDVDAVLDAVKELTKVIGEMAEENRKWFRAGKMGG